MELTALHNMDVILSDNTAASHFLLSVPLALFHQSRTHDDLTLIFNLYSERSVQIHRIVQKSRSNAIMMTRMGSSMTQTWRVPLMDCILAM